MGTVYEFITVLNGKTLTLPQELVEKLNNKRVKVIVLPEDDVTLVENLCGKFKGLISSVDEFIDTKSKEKAKE